jgi:predicted  nucleic acid-binding Zn-ribbon protein
MSYGGGAASAAAARRLSALEGDLAEARREVASERSRADKLQDEVWELRGLLKQSQENYDALVRRASRCAAAAPALCTPH